METGLFNSGRVRPEDLKKKGQGAVNETGINSVEDMKSTRPDEVAAMAIEGIERDAFWLLRTTEETAAKIRARADMILNRETPVASLWVNTYARFTDKT